MGSSTPIIAIVGLSVILGGCADQLRDPDPIFTTVVNEDLHTRLNDEAKAFNMKVLDAADDPENSIKVTKFLAAGLSVADTICISYLRYVEGIHSNLNFARQEANLLGGAVAGVLGLLKAATIEVAGAGIGFSLLDASLETYQDIYLIAPEFGDVRDLVEKAQSEVQTQLAANPPATYPAAKSNLESYFQICSHEGMRQLVRKAVKSGEPIATFGRGARDRFARLIADAKADELARELIVPLLGTDHLVGLYWIFAEGTGLEDKYLPTVAELLGKKLAAKTLNSAGTDLLSSVKTKVTKLKGLLLDLNEAHGGILAKRVAEHSARVDELKEARENLVTIGTEITKLQGEVNAHLNDMEELEALKAEAEELTRQLNEAKAVIDRLGDSASKLEVVKVVNSLHETVKKIETLISEAKKGKTRLAPETFVYLDIHQIWSVMVVPQPVPAPPLAPPGGGRLVIDVR